MKKGRFQRYIEKQNGFTEETNKVREMSIRLVKTRTDNANLIKKIEEEYKIKESIVDTINELNTLLKRKYNGRYLFDFIIDDEVSKEIDDLPINGKSYYSLKTKLFEVRDRFEAIKNDIEVMKK